MAQPEECTKGLKILVVSQTCYGMANRVKKAKSNCKRHAPRKGSSYYPAPGSDLLDKRGNLRFFGYVVDAEGAQIDDMGNITSPKTLIRLGEV